jgi:putative transposase
LFGRVGGELDILLQKRRDKAAAKRFFKRVLRSSPVPRKIVTDQLRSYSGAKVRNSGVGEREARVRKSGRPAEQPGGEQPPSNARTRASHARLSRPKRTQKYLACFGPIRQHFALKRHVIRAPRSRKQLEARFVAWREFAELAQNPSTAF